MNAKTDIRDDYRRQIRRCARAMSVARNDEVAGYIGDPAAVELVALFTDGNLEKRRLKLTDQLDLVAEAFDDLEQPIAQYIRTVPLAAYDTGASDADQFLKWLSDRFPITDEQRDLVVCQRSRYEIERQAAGNRLAHVRFQELCSLSEQLGSRWGEDDQLWIHLNPLRAWAKLETRALLDEESELPATVLFYPVGSDIHTAVLQAPAIGLVRKLKVLAPCRLHQLTDGETELDREEIVEIGHDLTQLGLAAFG